MRPNKKELKKNEMSISQVQKLFNFKALVQAMLNWSKAMLKQKKAMLKKEKTLIYNLLVVLKQSKAMFKQKK